MNVQSTIEQKVTAQIKPDFLKVENESNRHAVPANSETHFKVTVVSDTFNKKTLLARHRLMNQILQSELQGPVHALALHTFTNSEWQERNQLTRDSGKCLGKGH